MLRQTKKNQEEKAIGKIQENLGKPRKTQENQERLMKTEENQENIAFHRHFTDLHKLLLRPSSVAKHRTRIGQVRQIVKKGMIGPKNASL